jgi:hypothetical protein
MKPQQQQQWKQKRKQKRKAKQIQRRNWWWCGRSDEADDGDGGGVEEAIAAAAGGGPHVSFKLKKLHSQRKIPNTTRVAIAVGKYLYVCYKRWWLWFLLLDAKETQKQQKP